MLGVNLGFTLMLVLVGLGLGTMFQQFPWLYTLLKYAGALYLLYLAWKIAMAGPLESGSQRGRPFTFLQAALFQRSEEHTSELQSLMRISYAVFCLKKKN